MQFSVIDRTFISGWGVSARDKVGIFKASLKLRGDEGAIWFGLV